MAHYDESEFEQSGGGKWMRVIGIIVYVAIILAYAWQTLELVGWLFPGENWFMKVVTVFVCDGCATGYAMTEMFYRFKLRWSKQIIFGMWVITFVFSTAATIIQMYLSSTGNIPHNIDPGVVTVAYGIIIAAFVVNIIAITIVIRMEYNAGQPERRYLDDKPKKAKPAQSSVPVQIREEKPVPAVLPAPARDENAEMSDLVQRLRDLVASGKANGENFSEFGDDLKHLVNNTAPMPNETRVDVKPAKIRHAAPVDTEELDDDIEETIETAKSTVVSPAGTQEAKNNSDPLLDRVADGILGFLSAAPSPTKLQHKQPRKSEQ